jgi:hypothetical protein
MTASAFKDLILPAALLTGSLFTALTVPLALTGQQMGTKPLDIRFQDEQVYGGTVADAAMPYLGLAAALSLAAGGVTLGVGQWRRSLQSSKQSSQQVLTLEQQLKQSQVDLEEALFSDTQLQSSGLSFFLSDSPIPTVPASTFGTVTMGLGALDLTPGVVQSAPSAVPVTALQMSPLVQELVQPAAPVMQPVVQPVMQPVMQPAAQMAPVMPQVAPTMPQVSPAIAEAAPAPAQVHAFIPLPTPVAAPVARNSATPFHSPTPRRMAQMSPLPAAQSYLSFARNPTAPAPEPATEDLSIVGQVEQIQLQIIQLTAQMESLQTMVHQTIAVSAYTDYVAYSYPQAPQARYPQAPNNVQALRSAQRAPVKSPYIVNRSVDLYGVPQPPSQLPTAQPAAGRWIAS